MSSRQRWSADEKRQVWEYIYDRFKDGSIRYEKPTGIKFWEAFIEETNSTRSANTLNKYYRIHMRLNIAQSPLSTDQIDELQKVLTIDISPENKARLDHRRQVEDFLKDELDDEEIENLHRPAKMKAATGRRSGRLASAERLNYSITRKYTKKELISPGSAATGESEAPTSSKNGGKRSRKADKDGSTSANSSRASTPARSKNGETSTKSAVDSRSSSENANRSSVSASPEPKRTRSVRKSTIASSSKSAAKTAVTKSSKPTSSAKKSALLDVSQIGCSGFIDAASSSKNDTPRWRQIHRRSPGTTDAEASQNSQSDLSRQLASTSFLSDLDGSPLLQRTPELTLRKRRVVIHDDSSDEVATPSAKRAKKDKDTPKVNNNDIVDVVVRAEPVAPRPSSVEVVQENPVVVKLECMEELSEIHESSEKADDGISRTSAPSTSSATATVNVQITAAAPETEAPVNNVTNDPNGVSALIDQPAFPVNNVSEASQISEPNPPSTPTRNNVQLTPKSILSSKARKVNRDITPTRVTFGNCPTFDRPKSSTPLSSGTIPGKPTPTSEKYEPLYRDVIELVWNWIQKSRDENVRSEMTQEDYDKIKNLALTRECCFKLRQISGFMSSMFPPVKPAQQPQKLIQQPVEPVQKTQELIQKLAEPAPQPQEPIQHSEEPAQEPQEPVQQPQQSAEKPLYAESQSSVSSEVERILNSSQW